MPNVALTASLSAARLAWLVLSFNVNAMQTHMYVDPGISFSPMWIMRTMEVSVAMTPDRAPESPRPLQPGKPEYSL